MSIEERIHQTRGFASPLEKVLINLSYTAGIVEAEINTHLKQWGLSSQQYNILRILRGAKAEMKVQTITERMVNRTPNMTRMLDKLEEKKLVKRRHCLEDRRAIWVHIETKGLKFLEEISEDMPILPSNTLTPKEAETLSRLLDKLRGE
jgi:DNA-binding MarR family transcriptional regulator